MKNDVSKTLMLEAIKDPGALYAVPENVVSDDRLALAHKKKILKSWYADAEALLRAEDENMEATDKTGQTGRLIQSIKKAEAKLGRAS